MQSHERIGRGKYLKYSRREQAVVAAEGADQHDDRCDEACIPAPNGTGRLFRMQPTAQLFQTPVCKRGLEGSACHAHLPSWSRAMSEKSCTAFLSNNHESAARLPSPPPSVTPALRKGIAMTAKSNSRAEARHTLCISTTDEPCLCR